MNNEILIFVGFISFLILSNFSIWIYKMFIFPYIKTIDMAEYEKENWLENYYESLPEDSD